MSEHFTVANAADERKSSFFTNPKFAIKQSWLSTISKICKKFPYVPTVGYPVIFTQDKITKRWKMTVPDMPDVTLKECPSYITALKEAANAITNYLRINYRDTQTKDLPRSCFDIRKYNREHEDSFCTTVWTTR